MRFVLLLIGVASLSVACRSSLEPDYLPVPSHVRVRSWGLGAVVDWGTVPGGTSSWVVYVAPDPAIAPDNWDALGGQRLLRYSREAHVDDLELDREYWVVVAAGDEDTHGPPSPRLSMRALPDRLPTTSQPSWPQVGPIDGALWGSSLASAGDVDGDGDAELLLGAPTFGGLDRGRVFVYEGTPKGPGGTPVWDLYGQDLERSLGAALAAGDFNGDGFQDVVFGAPRTDYDAGIVESGWAVAFAGSDEGLSLAGPMWEWLPNVRGRFGYALAAGDVNGDNVDDIVVGAPLQSNTGGDGQAHLFLGDPNDLSGGPAWSVEGTTGKDLGSAVAVGNFDGVGAADVAVNDPGAGAVRVYEGQSGGVPLATPEWTIFLSDLNDETRFATGDVDRNGRADLVVGVPGGDSIPGRAYLFLGSQSGLSDTAAWTYEGSGAGDGFGHGLAFGDVNGDGFSDLAVGAPTSTPQSGGRLYVFLGGQDGLSDTPEWIADSTAVNLTDLGEGLTMVDFNGDGADEIVTGSGNFDVGGQAVGKVILFEGRPTLGPRVDIETTPGPGASLALGVTEFLPPQAGDHRCNIEWGDGATDEIGPCTEAELGSQSHAYAQPGGYDVRLTVTSPLGTLTRIVDSVRVE